VLVFLRVSVAMKQDEVRAEADRRIHHHTAGIVNNDGVASTVIGPSINPFIDSVNV